MRRIDGRITLLLGAILMLALVPAAHARETRAEHIAEAYAASELAQAPPLGNLPDYSLPPEKLQEAQHLEHVHTVMYVGETAWSVLQFVLLLWLGVVAALRDRATAAGATLRAAGKPGRAFWRECLVFSLLFNGLGALLELPLALFRHHLSRIYGLSIQGWPGWFGDWAKSLALTLAGGLLFFALLMWIIRSLPRGWWLACWAVVTPLLLFMIYVSPYAIDPLFNKFEPLGNRHPELVAQLERVVRKGHMDIPPERMFLMQASAKVTTLNAYVTGFGSSKRVVVWDTSLKKGTPDEVLFIFGHESGHYVLGHVLRGVWMLFFGLLAAFFFGYHFVRWSLARFGPQWRIPDQGDWGALAVLLFAFTLFSTVLTPVVSGLSRRQEHAADVYGQEAIHGLVTDPQATARAAFGVLGEASLEVPNPNQSMEFWTSSHPATGRRAAFARAYDPWAAGYEPRYFPAPGP